MRLMVHLLVAATGCHNADVVDTDTDNTSAASRSVAVTWCAAAGTSTDGALVMQSCLAPAGFVSGSTGDGVYTVTSGPLDAREP